MSGGRRTLDTEVERSVAVLPDAPEHWTYSSLKEVETCALRYALSSASYPDLWTGHGYPRAVHLSALFGDIVHDALERIIRALVAAGCTSASTPEAVVVLRALGGYSAVATEALEQRMARLDGNPRLNADRREQIQRQLADRVPLARAEVQARLRRVTLVPRPSRPALLGAASPTGGHARRALGPGTYAEVFLRADELRIKGRLDLLTITAESAVIADHKTGREDPSHLDQLRFYGALWEHDLAANPARTPIGELTVAYTAGDVTIQAPDASELDRITESIKARVHAADCQIAEDPPVATAGAHCQLCPVRGVCSLYWATMTQDPLDVAPASWFDFEGVVGTQNGAKSWWLLDRSGARRVLLLRIASGQVSLVQGQRLRLLGIRRDDDPEVDGIVATLTATSERFVMSGENAGIL
jgi:hypothetical protein